MTRAGMQVQAEIRFGKRSVVVPCFLDSGNCLREPVHGSPVLLAEIAAVADILPPELVVGLRELYEMDNVGKLARKLGEQVRPYQLLLDCRKYDWGGRLLLIPYASVCTGSTGAGGGLLLGFAPENVSFCLPDGTRRQPTEQPVLALYPQALRGLQGCRALVHPACVFGELMCDGAGKMEEIGAMGKIGGMSETVEMGEMERRLGA
jgi:stage II sporulation protein GA (sporulation sigma-E factor processing peptidase)